MLTKAGIPAAAAPLAMDAREAVAPGPAVRLPGGPEDGLTPTSPTKPTWAGSTWDLANDEAVRQAYQDIMDATRLYERWDTSGRRQRLPHGQTRAAWKSSWEPSPTPSTAPP